ncbi:hypothetical protein A3K73_00240 [Candidatus Pacearchaeota archaeon RBG_13_36_9]|nr:MAG: hypothetical protein A3K73_00240 [Candidatus Pacearchaeota archaeon RBG_13_36_9]
MIKSKERALVYFVAGLSSRYGGKIKAFAKIGKNKTLIEYSLNQALKSGFSKIIFVVGNKTEPAFRKKFKKSYKNIPVFYALQRFDKKERDRPWGTADALYSAKHFLNCPFIVCNGDDIYGERTFKILAGHLDKSEEEATVGYKLIKVLPKNSTVNRGIIKEKKGYVKWIKDYYSINRDNLRENKLKKQALCSMNIFALHPKTLRLLVLNIKKFKKQNKKDRKIECRLPHELSDLVKGKKIKIKIYSSRDRWYGITNPGDEKIIIKALEK